MLEELFHHFSLHWFLRSSFLSSDEPLWVPVGCHDWGITYFSWHHCYQLYLIH